MAPTSAPAWPVLVTEDMILSRDWRRRPKPAYKVSVVAEVFFAMSASWLRLHLSKGDDPATWKPRPVINKKTGEATGKMTKIRKPGVLSDMEFRRIDPESEVSARLFLLSDVQRMAERLRDRGKISPRKMARCLNMIAAQAALYGLYDAPDHQEPEEDPEDGDED